jgi:ABC-type Na+ efflux pump permease subunit
VRETFPSVSNSLTGSFPNSTLIVGGLGTFAGLLMNKAFGFDVKQSQLLSMPLGIFIAGIIMGSTYLVHRYK